MVVELIIRSNAGEINAWLKGLQTRRLPTFMDSMGSQIASDTQEQARKNVRERSVYHGKSPEQLEMSIVKVRLGGTSRFSRRFAVQALTPYASYVERGTKPHFIPFGLGKIQGVNHPGAKPMHFMRDAFIKAEGFAALRMKTGSNKLFFG